MPSSIPRVSVVAITYNHGAFIRDALEGFVAQETAFPVEFIIADDCSTDNTREIIHEYAERYPGKFLPVLHDKNVGIHANLTHALNMTRGRYIALCEGDDYWTDPDKLSKQAEYLDSNPDVALCFHPVQVVFSDGSGRRASHFPPAARRHDLSIDTLILRNFIQTNSVMYRRRDHYDDIPSGILPLDQYLHVLHSQNGRIAILPDTMATYRRHPQGIWFDKANEPGKFWSAHGSALAGMYEALLKLFPGDRRRRALIAEVANRTLIEIASASNGDEGYAVILDITKQHPVFAALALEHSRLGWLGRNKGRLLRRLASLRLCADHRSRRGGS